MLRKYYMYIHPIWFTDEFCSPVHTDDTFCKYTLAWNTSYNGTNCQHKDLTPDGSLGGNFVDVSLKVVVLNSVGTMLVSL